MGYCIEIGGECPASDDALKCQGYTCPEGKGKMPTCFICRVNGSKMCSGHCGLCEDQENGPEDSHPSERMHDGRPYLPGEDT